MMSLWDALRMNMMISYQELVRTFPSWSGFMGKNKLADVCEWLHLLVVHHAGRHAGFNQVPAGL